MTGAVSAGVWPPCLLVEPDCVVVRAGQAGRERERVTSLLLQLTGPPEHDVARVTVAAWLVLVVTREAGVTGSLTAGATGRVVRVGWTGLRGRTGQGGLVSPLLTDLLTSTHLSIVLSLATHASLSLRQGQAAGADLSFARVDILSRIMEEVAVRYNVPDSFTHRNIVRGAGHWDWDGDQDRSFGKVFFYQGWHLL